MEYRQAAIGSKYQSYGQPSTPPYIYQQDPRIWLKTTSNLRLSDYVKSITASHEYQITRSDLNSNLKNKSRKTDQPFHPTSGEGQVHVLPREGSAIPGFQPDENAKRELRERYYDKMLNEDVPMRDGMNYPYYRAYLDSLPDSTRHPSYYDSTFRYFPYTKSFYENSRVEYARNYESPTYEHAYGMDHGRSEFNSTAGLNMSSQNQSPKIHITHQDDIIESNKKLMEDPKMKAITVNQYHRLAKPALLLPNPPKVQSSLHSNLFSVSSDIKTHFREHFLGMIGSILPTIKTLVHDTRPELNSRPGLNLAAFIFSIWPDLHTAPSPPLSRTASRTLQQLGLTDTSPVQAVRLLLGRVGGLGVGIGLPDEGGDEDGGCLLALEGLLEGFRRVFEAAGRACGGLVQRVGLSEFTLEEMLRDGVLRESDSLTFEEFLSLLHANDIRFDHQTVHFLFNMIDENNYRVINCDAVHRFITKYASYQAIPD